ncbi:transketolase [Bacteroidales bacterium OttesenSCG-928-C19]|nr:transketolase [Bacteroidales bacterium OttesenSCG-928-C19]
MTNNIAELKQIANQVRRDIVRMTNGAKSGHPGGSLGCVEFFTALYFNTLKQDPQNFTQEGRGDDLFFLSNGHITPVYYSVLARCGYFPVNELSSFRKYGTRLQGHPSVKNGLPGVRVASGSLGQGMSVAIGAALNKKMNGDDRLVYTLHGDGELQEGQIWEAVMFAGGNKVDNLISTIDYNNQQIDGTVDQILTLGNLRAKFEAFGWDVVEVANGNDMEQMLNGFETAKSHTGKGKPVAIILKTEMGYGVDFMQGINKYHGVPPSDEELVKALGQLPETTLGDY